MSPLFLRNQVIKKINKKVFFYTCVFFLSLFEFSWCFWKTSFFTPRIRSPFVFCVCSLLAGVFGKLRNRLRKSPVIDYEKVRYVDSKKVQKVSSEEESSEEEEKRVQRRRVQKRGKKIPALFFLFVQF